MISAYVTSATIFLTIFLSLKDSIINRFGHNIDLWFISITIYTAIIFVVDLKLLVNTNYLTVFVIFSVFILSIAFYIGYSWAADHVFSFKIYKTMYALIHSPLFYLSIG